MKEKKVAPYYDRVQTREELVLSTGERAKAIGM